MSAWPTIKTAHQLVAEQIVPCSEDRLRALAKEHGVGRKLGRAYVFTPEDVRTLIEKLPCPSNSQSDTDHRIGTSAALSEDSALTKALAFASATGSRQKRSGSKGRRSFSTSPSTVIALPARSLKRP